MRSVVKTRYLLDKIAAEQARKLKDEGLMDAKEYHNYVMQYQASKKAYDREKEKTRKNRDWGEG